MSVLLVALGVFLSVIATVSAFYIGPFCVPVFAGAVALVYHGVRLSGRNE